MSDHAANDTQASTGSHDDDSTTSSTLAPNTPIGFYKRLAAWLTLYDQKSYFKDKVESFQAAGPAANEPEFTIKKVVRTLTELNNKTTTSSGAADLIYDALAAAHQHAKTR